MGGADAQTSDNAIEVVEVYGERDALYKALRSGDLRRTADLAATPQTMTILTQSQIVDSGKTDLKEILASQAGITPGTGENGNSRPSAPANPPQTRQDEATGQRTHRLARHQCGGRQERLRRGLRRRN